MPYSKQRWGYYDESKTEEQNIQAGNVFTPEKMNHIENGMKQLEEETFIHLNQKAEQSDLLVERSRIDSLTRLPEGSTTGDADLMDGRIGSLGNEYPNIGSAIREQIKNAISTNVSTKSFSITKDSTGTLLVFDKELYSGQTIEFSLVDNNNVVDKSMNVTFGLLDLNGNGIDDIAKIKVNTTGLYTLTKDSKQLRCWVTPESKLNSGTVTLTINYKESVYESMNNLGDNQTDLTTAVFGANYPGTLKAEHPYNAAIGADINISLPQTFLKGEKVFVELVSDGILKPETTAPAGIQYSTGYQEGAFRLVPNQELTFIFKENASRLLFWISKTNVLKSGEIKIVIRNFSKYGINKTIEEVANELPAIKGQIDNIESNSNSQTFSIIGDSYSTYKGWIPPDYTSWYANEGNSETNNVATVRDTWWWQLSKETKLSLLMNCSYSGSTIANKGYDGNDSSATSFLTRIKRDLGEGRATATKPDVIFNFGGTNDEWAGTPLGQLKYSGWTEADLNNVLPAFCYLIDYLITWNPNARIVNLVNTGLSPALVQGMQAACDHYGIENIVLTDVRKDSGHPNKAGMISIKNQVVNKFSR